MIDLIITREDMLESENEALERQNRILERALRLTAETLAAVWENDVSADSVIDRYMTLAEEQEAGQ